MTSKQVFVYGQLLGGATLLTMFGYYIVGIWFFIALTWKDLFFGLARSLSDYTFEFWLGHVVLIAITVFYFWLLRISISVVRHIWDSRT
jgi:hypothetical protein